MRVAFVGKGGAGKSALAGTFARALARRGERVVALDSDPLPGLAFSLGVAIDDATALGDAVEEKREGEQGPRFRLRAGLSALEAVEQYGAVAPDGVRFLQFGKHRGDVGPLVRSQFAFRQIVRDLAADGAGWSMVGDLPGGTRQPFFGWADFARTILIVVEPTAKSMMSARRLARLQAAQTPPERIALVVNKMQDDSDVDLVRARVGLEVVAAVPWDPALAEAERLGRPPIDHAPDAPSVRVVDELVGRLSEAERR